MSSAARKDVLAGISALAIPAVWLTLLLMMGVAETLVDPNETEFAGEVLDKLSYFWLLLGLVAVPVTTSVVIHKFGFSWKRACGSGAAALCLLILGTYLQYLLWVHVISPL